MIPLIGVTSYVERAAWGGWHDAAVLIPHRYTGHVAEAGGRPVVLPPLAVGVAETIDRLDGLLLVGGPDIAPERYGAEADPHTFDVRPERDEAETLLLRAALERDLPVLGICRGMQLLVVTHGGRLIQHLPDRVGHDRHRPAPGVFGEHDVRLNPGSLAAKILGEHTRVPSYHHQGVESPGSLEPTGWSDDGVVEAVESPGHRFCLGVLWHPDAGDDPRLFQALVAASQ